LTAGWLSGIVRSSFFPALRLPSVAASTLSSKRHRASAPAAKVVPIVPAATRAAVRKAVAKSVPKPPAAKGAVAKVVASGGKLAATVTVAKSATRVAPKPAREPAAKPVRKPVRNATALRPAAKRAPAKRGVAKRAGRAVPRPVRVVKIKSLDPFARCGPGTSVEHLYRVDENVDGRATVHLVFFDQYGWYCVHGRGCGAVADVHQELRAQRRSVPRLATTTRAAGR
jgi:hypothetical protein